MYANEETIQAIIDETLLRIPDKEEHKQFWKNTCIDITNFENKSIENLEPGAYIHYGALDSVYDLFPIESFNVKRNPETVAILTSCEMFVLEVDRRYKQLMYQLSGGGYVEFTDFACKIFVYNATDIDGDTGNFSRQFDFLWRSSWSSDGEGVSGVKTTIPWYNQNEVFQKYVNDEYVSTLFGYDSIVHKKGSDEYVYSFPEKTGTIALLENIPTKLSDLTNDSGYITIGSVGNGTLTITQNGTSKGTFSANQSGNNTVDITVPTKTSDLSNDSGYITIGSVGNGTLTIQKNGSNVQTFTANQSGNATANITVPTKLSDLTNDSGYITIGSVGNGTLTITQNGTSKGTFSANQNGNVSISLTDTTYESKSATSGGTELSLVTTGEKYTWNSKSNFSGAYSDLTGLPTLGTAAAKDVPSSGNASSTQVVLGSDTRLSDSRPASDVYSWAKASTKPSYTASEVGALPLSGGTMTGTINTPENNVALNFRPNNVRYYSTISYQTAGEEALVLATKMLITSFIFVNGEDSITNNAPNRWRSLTPGLQIKNNKVAIGKLITDGVTPTYALDVNGTVNATSFEGSGANLTGVVHTETDPTVPSWAKASTKPSYSYSEISGTPTIPTVGNGTLTIQKNGTTVQTFSANQSSNSTANITVPTKLSDLTNDSGYITIGSVGNGTLTITQNGTSKGTFSANQSGNSTIELTNSTYNFSGTTFYSGNSNTAEHNCNSAVKNGNYYYTSNGPTTTLGASATDGALYVQSYSDSWIAQIAQDYRNGNLFTRGMKNGTWQAWKKVAYSEDIPTVGNGTLTIQKNGTNVATFTANQSGNATANITVPTKLSELTNDSGYITSAGSCANADTLQNSAPDEGTGASTIVKRTSAGRVRAVYYNMSGKEDNINSFTSNVAFVSSEGWIRKTSKANFSTWLLTWTKLGSTTGNTQLSYTGTYTEFFVILDLGFYAETFYFVASALGAGRHFFGGTTNTADGSSWVLYARRSNSTYYFEVDRVHQDGTDYTSQVNVSVYAR